MQVLSDCAGFPAYRGTIVRLTKRTLVMARTPSHIDVHRLRAREDIPALPTFQRDVPPRAGLSAAPMDVVTPGTHPPQGVRSWRRAKIQFPAPRRLPPRLRSHWEWSD